ncbi:Metabotropic glutamate receptor 6, partial [Clonorchis sinensis]
MNHTSNNPDKYGNHVAFDENGDGDGKYSIYNYARHPYTGQYDYRLVGDYQGNKLTMRARPIWPGGQSSELPVSQCSEECGFAEVRRLDKKQQCCWSCEPCAENQRVVNLTTCETCPLHYGPSKNRTTCVALE